MFRVQSVKMMAESGSLTLKRTRVQARPVVVAPPEQRVQTGQFNCHRQAALTADRQVLMHRPWPQTRR